MRNIFGVAGMSDDDHPSVIEVLYSAAARATTGSSGIVIRFGDDVPRICPPDRIFIETAKGCKRC